MDFYEQMGLSFSFLVGKSRCNKKAQATIYEVEFEPIRGLKFIALI